MPHFRKGSLVITYDKKKKRKPNKRTSECEDNPIKSPKIGPIFSSPVCLLCQSAEVNDIELGELITKENITVHYFCLLFSSGLKQNSLPSDKKTIKGFLPHDILVEQSRGKRLKCSFCHSKGATVGCCCVRCKKAFHLPCGRRNGTLHLFFDSFRSFCGQHRPPQSMPLSNDDAKKASCAVCLSAVDDQLANGLLHSSCCKKSWLHPLCAQEYALSAGLHFFKCPLCNCLDAFQTEMLNFGIYIPDQDASWERQPNAFNELLERHSTCDAPECKCPKGRNHDAEKGLFDLILCHSCGSFGSHKACRGLTRVDESLLCPICTDISQSSEFQTKFSPLKRPGGSSKPQASGSDANSSHTDMRYHPSNSSTCGSAMDTGVSHLNLNLQSPRVVITKIDSMIHVPRTGHVNLLHLLRWKYDNDSHSFVRRRPYRKRCEYSKQTKLHTKSRSKFSNFKTNKQNLDCKLKKEPLRGVQKMYSIFKIKPYVKSGQCNKNGLAKTSFGPGTSSKLAPGCSKLKTYKKSLVCKKKREPVKRIRKVNPIFKTALNIKSGQFNRKCLITGQKKVKRESDLKCSKPGTNKKVLGCEEQEPINSLEAMPPSSIENLYIKIDQNSPIAGQRKVKKASSLKCSKLGTDKKFLACEGEQESIEHVDIKHQTSIENLHIQISQKSKERIVETASGSIEGRKSCTKSLKFKVKEENLTCEENQESISRVQETSQISKRPYIKSGQYRKKCLNAIPKKLRGLLNSKSSRHDPNEENLACNENHESISDVQKSSAILTSPSVKSGQFSKKCTNPTPKKLLSNNLEFEVNVEDVACENQKEPTRSVEKIHPIFKGKAHSKSGKCIRKGFVKIASGTRKKEKESGSKYTSFVVSKRQLTQIEKHKPVKNAEKLKNVTPTQLRLDDMWKAFSSKSTSPSNENLKNDQGTQCEIEMDKYSKMEDTGAQTETKNSLGGGEIFRKEVKIKYVDAQKDSEDAEGISIIRTMHSLLERQKKECLDKCLFTSETEGHTIERMHMTVAADFEPSNSENESKTQTSCPVGEELESEKNNGYLSNSDQLVSEKKISTTEVSYEEFMSSLSKNVKQPILYRADISNVYSDGFGGKGEDVKEGHTSLNTEIPTLEKFDALDSSKKCYDQKSDIVEQLSPPELKIQVGCNVVEVVEIKNVDYEECQEADPTSESRPKNSQPLCSPVSSNIHLSEDSSQLHAMESEHDAGKDLQSVQRGRTNDKEIHSLVPGDKAQEDLKSQSTDFDTRGNVDNWDESSSVVPGRQLSGCVVEEQSGGTGSVATPTEVTGEQLTKTQPTDECSNAPLSDEPVKVTQSTNQCSNTPLSDEKVMETQPIDGCSNSSSSCEQVKETQSTNQCSNAPFSDKQVMEIQPIDECSNTPLSDERVTVTQSIDECSNSSSSCEQVTVTQSADGCSNAPLSDEQVMETQSIDECSNFSSSCEQVKETQSTNQCFNAPLSDKEVMETQPIDECSNTPLSDEQIKETQSIDECSNTPLSDEQVKETQSADECSNSPLSDEQIKETQPIDECSVTPLSDEQVMETQAIDKCSNTPLSVEQIKETQSAGLIVPLSDERVTETETQLRYECSVTPLSDEQVMETQPTDERSVTPLSDESDTETQPKQKCSNTPLQFTGTEIQTTDECSNSSESDLKLELSISSEGNTQDDEAEQSFNLSSDQPLSCATTVGSAMIIHKALEESCGWKPLETVDVNSSVLRTQTLVILKAKSIAVSPAKRKEICGDGLVESDDYENSVHSNIPKGKLKGTKIASSGSCFSFSSESEQIKCQSRVKPDAQEKSLGQKNLFQYFSKC